MRSECSSRLRKRPPFWLRSSFCAKESRLARLSLMWHPKRAVNKSLATNFLSAIIILIGYVLPENNVLAGPLRAIGLFAASGALTNWLAIHMLFEKVPGLYGSGVVPTRFEEFKGAIRSLVMNQFFTKKNIDNFFKTQVGNSEQSLNPEPVLELVDHERLFEGLVESVMESPIGKMLGMFGGPAALDPLKEPFQEKMDLEIRAIFESPKLLEAIQASLQSGDAGDHTAEVAAKVEGIVNRRLDELTPQMVKTIVQDMIQQHLGWLVVWGGVFGGLIGLLTHLFL